MSGLQDPQIVLHGANEVGQVQGVIWRHTRAGQGLHPLQGRVSRNAESPLFVFERFQEVRSRLLFLGEKVSRGVESPLVFTWQGFIKCRVTSCLYMSRFRCVE